jgi:hypothetical protein
MPVANIPATGNPQAFVFCERTLIFSRRRDKMTVFIFSGLCIVMHSHLVLSEIINLMLEGTCLLGCDMMKAQLPLRSHGLAVAS